MKEGGEGKSSRGVRGGYFKVWHFSDDDSLNISFEEFASEVDEQSQRNASQSEIRENHLINGL